MTTLFAQPYDISTCGFYFDSFDDYSASLQTLKLIMASPSRNLRSSSSTAKISTAPLPKPGTFIKAIWPPSLRQSMIGTNTRSAVLSSLLANAATASIQQAIIPTNSTSTSLNWTASRNLPNILSMKASLATFPNASPFTSTMMPSPVIWPFEYCELTIAGKRFVYACR